MVVLALCNPILDIIAADDGEIVEKYGLELNNAIHADARRQSLFSEVALLPSVEYVAGGMVQNTIRIAQWMLQTAGATACVGCVGADANASTMREACESVGVNCFYMVDTSAPTGCCACLLRGSERAMCINLQAAKKYTLQHLMQPEIWHMVSSARIIYTNLNFLPDAIRAVARESSTRGTWFCINLTAPFWLQQQSYKSLLADLLPIVDVLFGNEKEAITWATTEGWDTADIVFIALRLSLVPSMKSRKRIVVITQGSENTIVGLNGHISIYPIVPLESELVVDTTGAGDSYAGGFLAALWKGRDLSDCCKAGAYAASVIIQHRGCTFGSAQPYAW